MIRKLIPAAVLLGGLAAASSALATTPCDKLAAMTAPDFKITASKAVAAGPFTPPGAKAALDLPAFCRVQAIATPTPDSDIRFEVWIPQGGAWNGKFQGVGTGGYQGSISYPAMGEALRRGYAVTSTDMGHQGDDLVFGQGHPEKVVDWAYRAIHVTAQAGKLVVRNATGRFPDRSYFVGCATGGHQAMSEVQRFPADYDGVIAGNPANNRLNETAGYLWAWRATHDAAGKALLSRADLQLVTNSATAACDSIDGVKDGVIDDPRLCRFDVASITCKGAKTASCLTSEQVTAVKKVHGGLKNPRTGEEIFPGWPLGSEGYGETANQGWAAFLVEPKAPMRSEVYKYFLFHDPNWDHRTFDFDRDVAYANAKIGFVSAIDDDLAPFRARGGKLIMYTGWGRSGAAGRRRHRDLRRHPEDQWRAGRDQWLLPPLHGPRHGPLQRGAGAHAVRHGSSAGTVGGEGDRAGARDRLAHPAGRRAAHAPALRLSEGGPLDGAWRHGRRGQFRLCCPAERSVSGVREGEASIASGKTLADVRPHTASN
jgi:feruloyl esterase